MTTVMFGVPGCVSSRPARAGRADCAGWWRRQVEGCYWCGVLAVPHCRRVPLLHDAPVGHRRVRVAWRKRVWRPRIALRDGHVHQDARARTDRGRCSLAGRPSAPRTHSPTTTSPWQRWPRLGVDWLPCGPRSRSRPAAEPTTRTGCPASSHSPSTCTSGDRARGCRHLSGCCSSVEPSNKHDTPLKCEESV